MTKAFFWAKQAICISLIFSAIDRLQQFDYIFAYSKRRFFRLAGSQFEFLYHNPIYLELLQYLLIIALITYACGKFSKTSAFLSFALQYASIYFLAKGQYGHENFAHAFLFYLFLIELRVDQRFKDLAWAGLQMARVHLCVIYFYSGYYKLTNPEWLYGTALKNILADSGYWTGITLANLPSLDWILWLLGLMVITLEVGASLLLWPMKTRKFVVLALCCLHIGIGLTMGIYFFSLFMAGLAVALFWVNFDLPVPKYIRRLAGQTASAES